MGSYPPLGGVDFSQFRCSLSLARIPYFSGAKQSSQLATLSLVAAYIAWNSPGSEPFT